MNNRVGCSSCYVVCGCHDNVVCTGWLLGSAGDDSVSAPSRQRLASDGLPPFVRCTSHPRLLLATVFFQFSSFRHFVNLKLELCSDEYSRYAVTTYYSSNYYY